MIKKFIIPVILFIPLALLQLTVVPFISYQNISPDLLIILIVYYTLLNGQLFGTILGFLLGILFDLVSGGLLGSSAFAYTLAAFIAGYFYNEKKINSNLNTLNFSFIILLSATIEIFIISILTLTRTNLSIVYLVFNGGIIPGFYTAFLSLFLLVFKPKRRIEE
jgi:rod shape-determining protein MreD